MQASALPLEEGLHGDTNGNRNDRQRDRDCRGAGCGTHWLFDEPAKSFLVSERIADKRQHMPAEQDAQP
jgi:hypothetical protein